LAAATERAARDLRLVIGRSPAGSRLRWTGPAPEGVHEGSWCDAAQALETALAQAAEGLATVSVMAPDFVRLHERAALLAQRLEAFTREAEPGAVRGLDAGTHLRLVESPLDIAQAVQDRLLTSGEAEAVPEA